MRLVALLVSSNVAAAAIGSDLGRPRRSARGQTGTSVARVAESPLANMVTSCPNSTSSSITSEDALGASVELRRYAFGERRNRAIRMSKPKTSSALERDGLRG
jgi:hypothetical protein